jgi:hypothetical protein
MNISDDQNTITLKNGLKLKFVEGSSCVPCAFGNCSASMCADVPCSSSQRDDIKKGHFVKAVKSE